MADAVIGALRVILGADTALFEKNLKSASVKLGVFAGAAAGFAAEITKGIGRAIGTLADAIPKAINQMEELGKASQRMGVPIEQLQGLKYAAEISDISLETLTKGVGKLGQAMTEAAIKPTSKAAETFAALGVSATDASGKLRPTADVLLDVAGKFAGLSDGAGKATAANTLFGRQLGQELIPFLNEGKGGIKGMMDQFASFGVTVSGEVVQSADQFNKEMKILGAIWDSIITQVAAHLLPALRDLSGAMIAVANDGSTIKGFVDTLTSAFRWLANDIQTVALNLGLLGKTWAAVKGLISDQVPEGVNPFRVLAKQIEDNKTENALLGAAQAAREFGMGIEFVSSKAPKITAAKNELDRSAFGAGKNLKAAQDLAGQMDAEAESIMKKYKTPAEEMQAEIQKINDAYARGILTQDQWAKAGEAAAQKVTLANASAAASGVSGFATLASELGKHSKSWAGTAKALAIFEATINTYTAFTKALSAAAPPFNYIMAAGTLAAGLAKVVAIKSQPIPAATGGSFRVPGGRGGGDSVHVPMLLEPGEQLDVWRPDQLGNDPRGRAGGGREVTIRADGAWMPFLEALIPQLNNAMRDGHQLKLVPV